MQFTAPLDDLIHGRVAVRVLRLLCLFPSKEFTGREMAREARVPPSNAIAELNRFYEQGIVRRRTAGRSQLWQLVSDHALAEGLRELFESEHGLGRELRQKLAAGLRGIPGVERAVLFGSTARGESRPSSDVDLLVIVKDARSKAALMSRIGKLRRLVGARYGNRLQPVVYTLQEWKARKGPDLVRAIEQEGQIVWERAP